MSAKHESVTRVLGIIVLRYAAEATGVAGKDACGPVASAVVRIIVVDFNFPLWKT